MKLEILTNIPESGSIEEVRFDATGDCTWVKFQDSDCLDWVGVFGLGFGGGKAVLGNSHGIAFILSNGQGYIINVNSRKLLSKTECDYLNKVISSDAGDIFVASTDTDIRVYRKDCIIFSTERIASDGINLKSCNDNIVVGEVWGFDKWYPFTLNIKNQKFECSWLCTF